MHKKRYIPFLYNEAGVKTRAISNMRKRRLKAITVTFVAVNLTLIYTAIVYVVSGAKNLEAEERQLLGELGCDRFVLIAGVNLQML